MAALLVAGLLTLASAQAQTKLGPAAPVTYDNKYEVYGGLNFMNFMAGQDIPRRMDFGGGELEGKLRGVVRKMHFDLAAV